MKPPSIRTLRREYNDINHMAFGGRLPRVVFAPYEKMQKGTKFEKDGLGLYAFDREAKTKKIFIAINWRMHCCRRQWMLTLIHEMCHYPVDTKKSPHCNTIKFQERVYRALSKTENILL